jgi:hypothetical protein
MKNSSPAAIAPHRIAQHRTAQYRVARARRWLLVLASLAFAGCTFLENEFLTLDRAPPAPPGAPSGGTARP